MRRLPLPPLQGERTGRAGSALAIWRVVAEIGGVSKTAQEGGAIPYRGRSARRIFF